MAAFKSGFFLVPQWQSNRLHATHAKRVDIESARRQKIHETSSGEAAADTRSGVLEWLTAHASLLGTSMDAESFERLCTESLPKLIGHQAMLAAVGRVTHDDCTVLHAWNFGCPPDLFDTITLAGARQPTLTRWLKVEAPIFIDSSESENKDSNVGLALARYKLKCRAVHGIVDGGGSLGSCVAFFGLDPSDRVRVTEGLRLVVPYLHVALMRLCRERSVQATLTLTERERQLVRLVVEGLSNPQIARQWSRSVATVRNLLHGLMLKLKVSSRAQLAVFAIQSGLLDSGIPLPPIL